MQATRCVAGMGTQEEPVGTNLGFKEMIPALCILSAILIAFLAFPVLLVLGAMSLKRMVRIAMGYPKRKLARVCWESETEGWKAHANLKK